MSRPLSPLVLLAIFLASVTASAQDANEPNDDFDTATPIESGGTETGTIHTFGDEDFFVFEISEAGVLEIDLSGIPGVDWYLALHNESRDRLAFWQESVGVGLSVTYLVQAGTHYVEVRDRSNNGTSPTPYDLMVSLDLTDPNEPNDTFDTAAPLTLGTPTTGTIRSFGDYDIFEVEVTTAGVLEIDLSGIAGVDWDLRLHNGARNQLQRWTANVGAPLSVTYLADVGTYYVWLFDRSENGVSAEPYDLTVSLDLTDPNELNNTFGTATLIGPDTFVPGTIWSFGDDDVYAFDVSAPGTVEIAVGDVPAGMNMYAQLYNPSQSRIDVREGNEGQSYSYQVNLTSDGRYFLIISDRSDNDISPEPYTVRLAGGVIVDPRELETGDVNGNGIVDAGDASLTLRSIVGLSSLTTTQRAVADTDGNGSVQAADASLILQFVVGLISDFPADAVLPKSASAPIAGTLSWEGWTLVPSSGEAIGIVRLSGATDASTAAELGLAYDPDLVTVLGVRSLSPEGWLALDHDVQPGETRVALAGVTPAPDGPLLEVRVRLADGASPRTLAATGRVGAGSVHGLSFASDGDAPEAYALEPVWPNPALGAVTLRYALPEAADVRLAVYTTTGRLIATLVEAERPAGLHTEVFNVGGLAVGTYVCRLEANGTVQTHTLTVVR